MTGLLASGVPEPKLMKCDDESLELVIKLQAYGSYDARPFSALALLRIELHPYPSCATIYSLCACFNDRSKGKDNVVELSNLLSMTYDWLDYIVSL